MAFAETYEKIASEVFPEISLPHADPEQPLPNYARSALEKAHREAVEYLKPVVDSARSRFIQRAKELNLSAEQVVTLTKIKTFQELHYEDVFQEIRSVFSAEDTSNLDRTTTIRSLEKILEKFERIAPPFHVVAARIETLDDNSVNEWTQILISSLHEGNIEAAMMALRTQMSNPNEEDALANTEVLVPIVMKRAHQHVYNWLLLLNSLSESEFSHYSKITPRSSAAKQPGSFTADELRFISELKSIRYEVRRVSLPLSKSLAQLQGLSHALHTLITTKQAQSLKRLLGLYNRKVNALTAKAASPSYQVSFTDVSLIFLIHHSIHLFNSAEKKLVTENWGSLLFRPINLTARILSPLSLGTGSLAMITQHFAYPDEQVSPLYLGFTLVSASMPLALVLQNELRLTRGSNLHWLQTATHILGRFTIGLLYPPQLITRFDSFRRSTLNSLDEIRRDSLHEPSYQLKSAGLSITNPRSTVYNALYSTSKTIDGDTVSNCLKTIEIVGTTSN